MTTLFVAYILIATTLKPELAVTRMVSIPMIFIKLWRTGDG
jgi:hypothetical protein